MLSYIADLDKRFFCCIVAFTDRHGLYAYAKRLSASGDGHLYLYLSVGLMLAHSQGQGTIQFNVSEFSG